MRRSVQLRQRQLPQQRQHPHPRQRKCEKCGRELVNDDIGLTKKLINRGAEEFLCISCLAKKFEVTVADLQKKIQELKEMGCTLF